MIEKKRKFEYFRAKKTLQMSKKGEIGDFQSPTI